ncbi:MAG: hypothetical protein AB8B99_19050 [Phormidesmis sp.]
MTNFNRISNRFSPFYSADSLQKSEQSSNAAHSKLEQIWNLPSTNRAGNDTAIQLSGTDLLKRLGKQLVAFLTGEQHMRIWTTYSKAGVVWHVYDPVSDRHASHASESDLRTWLETRHLD